jgi:hypothetical protein
MNQKIVDLTTKVLEEGKQDEDENVDRIIPRDNRSEVSSFGRRTDAGDGLVQTEERGRVDPTIYPKVYPKDKILKEIALYVGAYEGYFPELLRPGDDSSVIPGQIPATGSLGSVSRRMMSVQDMSDKTAIKNWNLVEFRDRFVSKEQMLFSHELYLCDKQARVYYVVPMDTSVRDMTKELRDWAL